MLNSNNTPLAAIGFEQWHSNGSTMAVISARGRIRIEEDDAQYFEENVNLVLADEYMGDALTTSMVKCNDLIPFKPSADVTINAVLQSAEPSKIITGIVRVGNCELHLRGSGPRYWYHGLKWHLSEPELITELPVCYSKTSGGRYVGHPEGKADLRNPIGPGVIDHKYTPKNIEIPAPQIDSTSAPISLDPTQPAAPQGLLFIPPWWANRHQFAGTYDDNWKENIHPRLPTDFDYRHYQVAPSPLILSEYLHPGMRVETSGFRPGGGHFSFEIPDFFPFASFNFSDGRVVVVKLNLDGLHLDLTSETPKYDLTWRAWMQTCPSFSNVDLDMVHAAKFNEMQFVISGPNGLGVI